MGMADTLARQVPHLSTMGCSPARARSRPGTPGVPGHPGYGRWWLTGLELVVCLSLLEAVATLVTEGEQKCRVQPSQMCPGAVSGPMRRSLLTCWLSLGWGCRKRLARLVFLSDMSTPL
jgi:hypothetical protein